jgi:alkylation response protein AidB-like acyl-CoA dehydrogenase
MSKAANKITVLQPLNTNGFFECLMPKILGGEEYSLAEYSHLIQSVSQKDGSTGWRLMIGSALNGAVAAFASDSAIASVFKKIAKKHVLSIVAGQTSPRANVTIDKQNITISGKFKFGSGLNEANWVICGFIHPLKKIHYLALIPKDKVLLKGGWNTFGLTDTASQDYEVEKQLLSNDFIFPHDTASPVRGGKTFCCGLVSVMLAGHIGVALGLAKQASLELKRLVGNERRSGKLASRDDFLIQLGRNEAKYFSAKAYADYALTTLDRAATDHKITQQHHDHIRLAALHATEIARDFVRFAFDQSGMVPVFNESKLNTIFRDIHVASQHLLVNSFQYKAVTQRMIEENYDI